MTEKAKHLKKFNQYFEVKEYFNEEQNLNGRYVTCAPKSGDVIINGDVNISEDKNKNLPNFDRTTVIGDFNVEGDVEYKKLPQSSHKISKKTNVTNIPNDYMIKRRDLAQKGFGNAEIVKIYMENRFSHFKYKQSQRLNKILNKNKSSNIR